MTLKQTRNKKQPKALVKAASFSIINPKKDLLLDRYLQWYKDTKDSSLDKKSLLDMMSNKLIGYLNTAGGPTWGGLLNYAFMTFGDREVLAYGCDLQLPAKEIIIREPIVGLRGTAEGQDGGKYPTGFNGSTTKGGDMTTIKFEGINTICWTMRRSVKFKDIEFIGCGQDILFLEPYRKEQPDNPDDIEDDADSSVNDCIFRGYQGNTAITCNTRNTKINGCLFLEKSGKNSVGIWHYFRDIEEDDGTRGQNRKNKITYCYFDQHRGAFGIRLGRSPGDGGNGNNYSHYDGMSINNCIVSQGRFLLIDGAKVGNSKQQFNGFLLTNNIIDPWQEGSVKGSMLRASNAVLSIQLSGSEYIGNNNIAHAIYIDETCKVNALTVNAVFDNFESKAIVVGPDKTNSGILLNGRISHFNVNQDGRKGVGYIDNGKIKDWDPNGNQGNQMDDSEQAPTIKKSWLEPDTIKYSDTVKGKSIDLNEVWEKRFPKDTVKFNGEKKRDYTRALNWLGKNANNGQKVTINQRSFVTGPITINRELNFTASNPGDKNNIVFWTSKMGGAQYGMTVNAKCNFNRVGFTTSGADEGERPEGHSWKNEKGMNLIKVTRDGGMTKFENCGFAGFRKRCGIFFDTGKNGRIIVQRCAFKDAKESVCIHLFSSQDQSNKKKNLINDNLFHTGGRTTPVLIGSFREVAQTQDLSTVCLNLNRMDIGGYFVGVKMGPKGKLGTLKILNTAFSGAVNVDNKTGQHAVVDIMNGKFGDIRICQNVFTTATKQLEGDKDFVSIRYDASVSGELVVVSNTFEITEASGKNNFSLGIGKPIMDSNAKVYINGTFNGNKGLSTGDDAVKLLKQQDTSTQAKTNLIKYYTPQMYQVVGKKV